MTLPPYFPDTCAGSAIVSLVTQGCSANIVPLGTTGWDRASRAIRAPVNLTIPTLAAILVRSSIEHQIEYFTCKSKINTS